jgi:hypothetical protein
MLDVDARDSPRGAADALATPAAERPDAEAHGGMADVLIRRMLFIAKCEKPEMIAAL